MKRHVGYVLMVAAIGCVLALLTPVGPAVAQSMKPLLTLDVENPARHPFEQQVECNLDPGNSSCEVDVVVPSDRALAIETITARTFVPIGQRAVVLSTVPGSGVAHYISLHHQGTFVSGQSDALSGTHPVRLYAGPGTSLRFIVSRNDNIGSGIFQVSVSGHLVDCDADPGCSTS